MATLIQTFLSAQIWAWILVFSRVGAALMVMPAFGDTFVNTSVRLALALALSFVVAPIVAGALPPEPGNLFQVATLVAGEVVIGLFVATVARLLVTTLELTGTFIGMQSGLANATMFNPAMSSQGSLPGALLGWLGLLLIFVTDLHHLLLASLVDSYVTFRPGLTLPAEDMATVIARVVSDTFSISVRLSAPFFATGLVFSLALGLLNKLAPQIQVYFLFLSAQVALGLILFSLTLSAMMFFWLGHFEQTFLDVLHMR